MATEVEEYTEIVETYTSNISENYVAPARQLEPLEYARSLTKVQREDSNSFNTFLNALNADALQKISAVAKKTIQEKVDNFQLEMERLKKVYKVNKEKMHASKLVLLKWLRTVQQEELARARQLDQFIDSVAIREMKARCFRAWNVYRAAQKFNRSIIDFCKKYRERRQKDKCFNEWKYMITKYGIELKLKRKYEEDLNNYKEEYLSVIALLQENIKNVEDQIQRKRQSRKEFSFNLSRNLLKTISNLSMEVVSLNQYAIKDKEINNELDQINLQIKQKLKNIEGLELKVTLEEEEERNDPASNTGIFSQNVTRSSVIQ